MTESETETETETDGGGEVRGDVDRAETGEFLAKYDDNDVVEAFVEAFPEPLSASEISERVGCSRGTAHNRADHLVEEGLLKTKKLGARSRVFWLDADGDLAIELSPGEPVRFG